MGIIMNNDNEPVGFYVSELEAGVYSVRLDLVNLVAIAQSVRTFTHWMLTRAPTDKVLIYLENGTTDNPYSAKNYVLRNVSDLVKAIQLSPAYNNIVLIVTQMVIGAGSYLVLSTPAVKWGPLGFVMFDGWTAGKALEDYDQGMRADIRWLNELFLKGVEYKLFTEDAVRDHREGRSVTLGTNRY